MQVFCLSPTFKAKTVLIYTLQISNCVANLKVPGSGPVYRAPCSSFVGIRESCLLCPDTTSWGQCYCMDHNHTQIGEFGVRVKDSAKMNRLRRARAYFACGLVV